MRVFHPVCLILLCLCLALCSAGLVFAADISVDEDCSLAAAIIAANNDAAFEKCPAGAGDDTITLTVDVTLSNRLPAITTDLTIDGADKTISGDRRSAIFSISEATVTLKNMTVTKGLTGTRGAAIHIEDSDLTLSGATISESQAGDAGGGVYANNSSLTISNSIFRNNKAGRSGGAGVYFSSSTAENTLRINNKSFFTGNVASQDGGALRVAGGSVIISKSSFFQNRADEGGVIEIWNGSLYMENSTLGGNQAREGGAINAGADLDSTSDITLVHVTSAYNTAQERGASIALTGSQATLNISNTIVTGSASEGVTLCHPGISEFSVTRWIGNIITDSSCPLPTADDDRVSSQAVSIRDLQEVSDVKLGTAMQRFARAQGERPVPDRPIERARPSPTEAPEEPAPTATPEQPAPTEAPEEPAPTEAPEQPAPTEAPEQPAPTQAPDRSNKPADPTATEALVVFMYYPLEPGSPAIDSADPDVCEALRNLQEDTIDTTRPQAQDCDVGAYEVPVTPTPTPTPIPPTPIPPTATPLPPGSGPFNTPTPVPPGIDLPPVTPGSDPPGPGTPTAPPQSPPPDLDCVYTVQAGDTLYALALRFETTVEELKAINLIAGDALSAGQWLYLPSCEPPSSGDPAPPGAPDSCNNLPFGIIIRAFNQNVSCEGVNISDIDKHPLMNAGIEIAVKVWGRVDLGAEVCVLGGGSLVFMDTTTHPPAASLLPMYSAGEWLCARLDKAGTIVHVSPLTEDASIPLIECVISTTDVAQLRDEAGGAVIEAMVPYGLSLPAQARTAGWFQVNFMGIDGWLSADAVQTDGICA